LSKEVKMLINYSKLATQILDDSRKVADFDLPEQSLVVIEIDDENRSGTPDVF
jgi:hypothetical protein